MTGEHHPCLNVFKMDQGHQTWNDSIYIYTFSIQSSWLEFVDYCLATVLSCVLIPRRRGRIELYSPDQVSGLEAQLETSTRLRDLAPRNGRLSGLVR